MNINQTKKEKKILNISLFQITHPKLLGFYCFRFFLDWFTVLFWIGLYLNISIRHIFFPSITLINTTNLF